MRQKLLFFLDSSWNSNLARSFLSTFTYFLLPHIDYVTRTGLYTISSATAGEAIQAAFIDWKTRVLLWSDHHASGERGWGLSDIIRNITRIW